MSKAPPVNYMPTHEFVAERLGLSVATVSRLRTGDRLPSLEVMIDISEMTKWGVDAQAVSRQRGTYAQDFNEVLAKLVETQA